MQSRAQIRLEWLFWFVFMILWFVPLGYRALLHTDEGRYATIALNMLMDHDWVTPRLNGILYFEKPILQYWASAFAFLIFGVSDFTARLWPALTGFFTVLFLAFTAGKIWGRKERQFTAIIAGGMIWIVANAHFLTVDMGATFFLTVALCSFILSQHSYATTKEQIYWMITVWAAMAFAVLSKGLIGILIPGATLVLYSLINGQWRFWKDLQWIWGGLIFALIAVPWFVLVSHRNDGFAHFFFIHEHWERFLTTEHKRTGPIWYFVPYLILGALPWTTWLPRLFMNGIKENTFNELRIQRLLLIWSLFIFLFFSKSGSKLSSYILPMFPAIALMLAWHMNRVSAATIKKHLILPALLAGGLIIAYFLSLKGYFVKHNESDSYLQILYNTFIWSGVILAIALLIAWYLLNKQQRRLALLSLTFGMLVVFNISSVGYDGYGARYKSTRDIVSKIKPNMTPETEIFSVGYYDQTFPFYLRRNVTLVNYVDEFEFGENEEPHVWIPNVKTFVTRWNSLSHGVAVMSVATYKQFKKEGLPMTIIYQDYRRIVVDKPEIIKQ